MMNPRPKTVDDKVTLRVSNEEPRGRGERPGRMEEENKNIIPLHFNIVYLMFKIHYCSFYVLLDKLFLALLALCPNVI